MPSYRAGPSSSGLFGGYATPPARPLIDVGSSIDSFVNGASSLIQQAYQRKRLDQQLALEQQREAREAAAQQAELAFKQKEASDRGNERAQDFQLRQESERHRFIEAGGIPASTQTVAQPAGQAPITPWQPQMPSSPIARAMGGATGGVPGVQVTPSNAPASSGPGDRLNANPAPAAAPGSVPVNRAANVETPESYDPTRSGAFERAIEVQRLRSAGFVTRDEARNEFQSEQQAKRLAAQQSGREFMTDAARSLARLKATLATNKGSVAKAMTGNQLETARQHAASGLLDQASGSYDNAQALLQSPDGKPLRDLGVEPRHLMFAHSQYVKEVSGQASRLQAGALGLGAGESVAQTDSTRKLVGGAKPSSPSPSGGAPVKDTPGPIDFRTPNTAATPGTSPATAPAKPKAGASSSDDNFSDDEVLAAYTAGKKTDKEIRDYIVQQRAKKLVKPGKP